MIGKNIGELRLWPLLLTTVACILFALFLYAHVPFVDQQGATAQKVTDLSVIADELRQISNSIAHDVELHGQTRTQLEELAKRQEATLQRIDALETRIDAVQKKQGKKH
jgi:septal ring factor EnvC (AmiA/AmiB activator)